MDIKQLSFRIEYRVNGIQYLATGAKTEHFSLKTSLNGNKLLVTLCPKQSMSIDSFTVKCPYTFTSENRIYVNGYQSWTDSLEYRPDEQMSELSGLTEFGVMRTPLQKIGFSKSGDLNFHKYPRSRGIFYGWSYGYVRSGEQIDLFGSLSERSGYTTVTFDAVRNCVLIGKDLEGVTYTDNTEILSFTFISDTYENAFDEYFKQMGITCREHKKRTGYTTWYNYYGSVTNDVVKRDLENLSKIDAEIDCFQIDDGYQAAVGDWLITDKKKFPEGMKEVADRIHEKGMTAGLWLAPFAAVRSSQLFKNHPDWFIKDAKGKPYNTGHNWGGFYSLDIYNKDAEDYIRRVFDVVLNEWGYDLVKLDFLYGACVLPMHNKSRGEIMCDAMDLLRDCCGEKLILGCGVPLMPAFGKVDYCRIGSDISLSWHHRRHSTREDVSTPHAVSNTIFRRHLNGRAWMNDPDVFLLRDENIKMDFNRRKLLSKINSVFGSLLFVSDNVGKYNSEQLQALKNAFSKEDYTILCADFIEPHIMKVKFSYGNRTEELTFDIWNGTIISDKVN